MCDWCSDVCSSDLFAGIVTQAFGALAIGFTIMVERLGMKLAVVIGAREREMQRYAVALIDRDGDGALHLVDVGVGQDPALDSGEAPPGLPALDRKSTRLNSSH